MNRASNLNGPDASLPVWRYVAWIAVVGLLTYAWYSSVQTSRVEELSYSELKQAVKEGRVEAVRIKGQEVTGELRVPPEQAEGGGSPQATDREAGQAAGQDADTRETAAGDGQSPPAGAAPEEAEGEQAGDTGKSAETRLISTTVPGTGDPELLPLLEQHDVEIHAEEDEPAWWARALIGVLPWILLIGLIWWGSRKMQERMMGGGEGGPLSFAKSKAKRFREESTGVGFDDVAGLQNAKRDLQEVVGYLKDPSRFRKMGADIPNGMLLMGPPGTGKTLLARAVAGEAQVPFYSISGSEFIEMFVGVGASRVRDMFENAKKDAPAIIFIDELDAIGRARGAGLGGGHDEREQTLNQILSEMDGFSPQEAVMVLAATNRPDVLDKALLRPGRFDRKVTLELPDREAREAILGVHARDVPTAQDVDLGAVARRTVGFSGADLQNLVNEAALLATRENTDQVDMAAFDAARDKILLGERREAKVDEEERKVVAYHESGHALLAWHLPHADRPEKITIIPRGRALGATEQIPAEERYNLRRSFLDDRIGVMLGGRVAEQVVYGEVTTGAEADLKQATQLARKMVCQWGMSEKLGPVTFQQGEEHVFLGRELAQQQDFSDATARIIDEEIHDLITGIETRAREIVEQHREQLDALVEKLLDQETLEVDEVSDLLEGKKKKDQEAA